jgi:hypothetical protein
VLPVVAAGLLLLAGCGGDGGGGGQADPVTTTAQAPQPTAEELRWAQRFDAFVTGLLPDLRRLERLTGGGPKTGTVGNRLDPRIFAPGPERRQFEAAMTALAACRPVLAATVPPAPTARLRRARATLVQACGQLEQVPAVLRADVLRAGSPAGVKPAVLAEAAARAGEGVRSLVGGLTTLRRLLGSLP